MLCLEQIFRQSMRGDAYDCINDDDDDDDDQEENSFFSSLLCLQMVGRDKIPIMCLYS